MAQRELEKSISVDELKQEFGLKRKPSSSLFKAIDEEKRIYPGYFTNVIRMENGKRIIEPMRYRVRPNGSKEEIPSKFNVFNARIDALEKRKTWSPLFMRNHGIFVFSKFFEWVEKDGKKQLINFYPRNKEMMWAPCLWDSWQSKNGKFSFKSFAIITNEPAPEVESMGHDRCPIFLDEQFFDDWLSPEKENIGEIYEILNQTEMVTYQYSWA